MKITVKDLSYEKVMAIPEGKRKKPMRQGAFWRFLLATLSKGELKSTNFTCKAQGMEKLPEGQPALYLMNHSSFTDLQIAATLLKKHPFHIICTNDGFIGKEALMRMIGCIPARKFITDTAMVKDMKYALDKLHSSVLMYPEASYSFDGSATDLPDSLGKCIKLLKVPFVMIKTKGVYLRDPLYNNLQKRKTDISADMIYLFSPEEIKELTADEINAKLKEMFTYDHFRDQKERGVLITEPFRGDGLHRALYKCAACGVEGKTEGKGIHLTCHACGVKHTLNEDGTLGMEGGTSRFTYVPDWYRWERECVKEEIQAGTYQAEYDVDILMLADMKSMYRVGEGHLSHTAEGFHLTGCDGKLDYRQSPLASYSLYADYFWYEIGDVIAIGDARRQYYCFPKKQKEAIVAKARLAQEEMYKLGEA